MPLLPVWIIFVFSYSVNHFNIYRVSVTLRGSCTYKSITISHGYLWRVNLTNSTSWQHSVDAEAESFFFRYSQACFLGIPYIYTCRLIFTVEASPFSLPELELHLNIHLNNSNLYSFALIYNFLLLLPHMSSTFTVFHLNLYLHHPFLQLHLHLNVHDHQFLHLQ